MPVSPPSPSPSGADAADRALDARPADDPISAEHPPVPGRPKRRRWLARTAGILAALVLLVAAGLAGLWVWSGSDQSLATLLRQAERRMPAGQTLAAQDVSGSLRRGGRIGALRWQNESLAVELRGIDIGWQLGPLLQRKVQLGTVRIADVDVTRTGPAKESEPLQPLQNLTLPVRIDVPFQVDRIRWAGPPETVATALAGRYRYDGSDHRLDIDGVDVANGEHAVRLDVRLQLQGAAPMALDAAVNARVRTPVPGSDTRLTVLAGMTAKGTLATEAARLAVEARVRPLVAQGDPLPVPSGPGAPSPGARSPSAADPQAAAVRTAEAMQAALQATIAPWLPQPVLQADARFQALDVARLYPDLPETLLDGQVTVLPMTPAAPAGTASASATTPSTSTAAPASPATVGWRIDADLRNALPGPWDRQRLPVESLKGRATFDGRLWDVPGMVVALGGGTIDLAGRFGGADAADRTPASGAAGTAAGAPAAGTADTAAPPAVWQGRATLARISPAALHTQLDPTPIGGTMSARTAGSAIDFDAALQPDGTAPRPAAASGTPRRGGRANAPAAASPIQALRLRSAVAQGRWDRQVLDLRVLRIRTQDADLQGQLRVQTAEQSGSGKLALALPGGQATVEGAMAPTDGKGDAAVRIDDAARVVAWLKTLPGLSDALAGAAVQGAARLDARWNGGWKSVQQRLDTGTLPAGARDLTLQATLAAPRLDARLAAAAPPPGRTSVAASASTPATATAAAAPTVVEVRDLRAELSGSLRQMDLSLQSTARADGRRLALQARGSGGMDGLRQFRAALASLSLRAEDPTVGGPWTLQLGAPLTATVRTGAAPATPPRAAARPGAPAPAGRLEIDASAGRATLAGPAPGTLSIDWEPVRYVQDGAARRLRSAGRLQGLPMAWLDALSASGASALKDYGIQGNLVFDGDWDIDAGDSLRAKARLARRSGDLRVQTGGEAVITKVESSGPTVTSAPAGAGTGTAPAAPTATASAVANPAAPKVAAAPAARSATPEPTTSAGLRAASIEVDAQGDAVAARLNWDSERAGQVQGEVRSRIAREGGGWVWPADAPLAGSVRARMPRIGIWSVLAPPGWRVQGTLDADIAIAGTRAAPQWSGTLKADDLGVRSVVDGIELRDGRLRATLRGTRLDIEEFRIAGARGGSNRIAGYSGSRTNESGTDGGLLTAQGNVAWEPVPAGGGSGMRMDIQAQARALRLSARSDRQLTVSGDLRTRLENGRLVVRGALRTDRAVIILPDESTPSLGSDVVVRSAAKDREAAEKAARAAAREEKAERAAASPAPQTAKPPDILVSFDLGDDFAVQGYGLTTQLTGKVDVRSDRGLAAGPQVTGEIRTARGRYRAYGQQLDIETGIIRFIGPYDNPTLEILALRPNITVRAGVRITGTALSPQVRLYSEPVMTDAETLSWVVLGRSTANGGAEAALLQQAALAFLSGSGSGPTGGFASKLGLDEVGFKGPGSGEDAASAALTFGKRISRNLYVTYERSLSGTLGTLYIFYDLTRRFTLRGQAGVKSGLDLIYTLPYD